MYSKYNCTYIYINNFSVFTQSEAVLYQIHHNDLLILLYIIIQKKKSLITFYLLSIFYVIIILVEWVKVKIYIVLWNKSSEKQERGSSNKCILVLWHEINQL